MKFVVQGTDYVLRDLIDGAPIGDIRQMRKITKGQLDQDDDEPRFQGVTPRTFKELFIEMGEQMKAGTMDPADLLSDDRFLIHIQALIWLSLRRGNRSATWDDAAAVPLTGFGFQADDDEVEEDEDPKAQPGSEADDEAVSPETSTTSNDPSSPGFP